MAEAQVPRDQKDIEENKTIAALGYVWILCLVPLILKRKSPFAQFHAKQGLILFIVEVIGSFIFWIPIIGWALFAIVGILAIIGIVQALDGKYWKMPIFGQFVEKLNL